MNYTKIKNVDNDNFWDIITPDGNKLVTVTHDASADKLLEKLNKDLNNE